MKKVLSVLLVAMMLVTLAVSASAEQWTLPDLDCTAWWTHNEANQFEIKEGVTVLSLRGTTNADIPADQYYRVPSVLLYTSGDGKMNTAGYKELWLNRSDNYGWTIPGDTGYYNIDGNPLAGAENLTQAGIVWTSEFKASWDEWVGLWKQGVDVVVTINRSGDKITVEHKCGELIVMNYELPVPAAEKIYLSLTGDGCKLSNIAVNYTAPAAEGGDNNDNTGDAIVSVIALMAVSAMGIIVMKKRG